MAKKKFDLDAAFDELADAAETFTDNRFSHAADVLASEPNGLAAHTGRVQSANSEGKAPSMEQELVEGQTYALPLYRFSRSENNARHFYSPEELDDTATSLREKGQDVPVIGYLKDTKIVLVDGGKRLQAATSAGIETLKVQIRSRPESDAEEYEQSRRVNISRSTQTPIDDAIKWNELLKRGVYATHDELGERNGVDRSMVTRTLALNAVPDRILRMMNMHEKTRSLSTAYEICRIFTKLKDDPEKASQIAEEVIEEIRKEALNRNDAKTLIDGRLEPPEKAKRTRETPSSTDVKFGEAKGVLKVFPAKKKLDLSFTGLELDQINQLKELIEQMLTGQISL